MRRRLRGEKHMKRLTDLCVQISQLMGRPRKHTRDEKAASAHAIERMVANMYVAKDLSAQYRKEKEQGIIHPAVAQAAALAAAASGYRRQRREQAATAAELHRVKISAGHGRKRRRS